MEPRIRSVVVGRMDHAHLQLHPPALALFAEAAPQPDLVVEPVVVHQPGNVVRAVRDHRAWLSHEYEPWQWAGYVPTIVDYSILIGSFGWFFMWFLLFIRQLPVIALTEIKEIVPPRLKRVHHHPPTSRTATSNPIRPGEFA